MRHGWLRAVCGASVVVLWLACGGGAQPPSVEPSPPPAPAPRQPAPPPPPSPVFQPAFHQALRWSVPVTELSTFRLRVPVHRAGQRLRLAFRAGDGTLQLTRAFVARAGEGGALASAPVPVRFGNEPGFRAPARARTVSDPVAFEVKAGDELAVSLEVQGALAAGAIALLPGSSARVGAAADAQGALTVLEPPVALGLQTVEVEGPPGPAVVALGDSITEGFVSGHDDVRNAWPAVASRLAGVPVVNAGVSSQGVWDALEHLDGEVTVLPHVTDCVVLLGTNNLGNRTAEDITAALQQLYDRLAPFCRVWAATLLPKERTSVGDLATVLERRKAVNAWIRTRARVAGVWDAEAALAVPDQPDLFRAGLAEDLIHPSVAGQQALGESAAAFLREKVLAH